MAKNIDPKGWQRALVTRGSGWLRALVPEGPGG